jgi:hypothetical protein
LQKSKHKEKKIFVEVRRKMHFTYRRTIMGYRRLHIRDYASEKRMV